MYRSFLQAHNCLLAEEVKPLWVITAARGDPLARIATDQAKAGWFRDRDIQLEVACQLVSAMHHLERCGVAHGALDASKNILLEKLPDGHACVCITDLSHARWNTVLPSCYSRVLVCGACAKPPIFAGSEPLMELDELAKAAGDALPREVAELRTRARCEALKMLTHVGCKEGHALCIVSSIRHSHGKGNYGALTSSRTHRT